MQAVILAAGMANRLKPLTDHTPKCLLSVGKKTILDYTLENLKENGIHDLVVVTGFEKEKIMTHIIKNHSDLKTEFIENKDYASTNNAYSLLLAEKALTGDFILLDSDIIFHPGIIQILLDCPQKPVLAVNRHECGEEEIKVLLGNENKILEISKTVEPKKAWGESIGIEVFSDSSRKVLFQTLKKRIINEKRVNEYYEASFEEMIQNGSDFYAEDASTFPAMEIDFAEDLERARKLIQTIY